jgi:two-component system, chemotaxis family, protein-glutamate methylesterase/glutaminase
VIRVLIAEDSAVQREFLTFILEESGHFEIVGIANDGEEAVEMAARLRPDIILMDCHMPKLDGIGATRIIMETTPTPIVMASASVLQGEVKITFDAVKNGALAVVNKPPAFGTPHFDQVAAELVRTLRLMAEVKVVRRWPLRSSKPAAHVAVPRVTGEGGIRAIGIAGSTGAPGIISDILAGLAERVCAPVLIVQHMADGFVEGFAAWLTARTGMSVTVAQDGQLAEPGCAYIAPDGLQMGIAAGGRIVLSSDPDDEGFRPSGTFLLRSIARTFGARAIGIVLTGMGRDGVSGLLELRGAGGITIAQDEQSCVVFGMPREAVRQGAAAHVLAPPEIVAFIVSAAPRVTARVGEGSP